MTRDFGEELFSGAATYYAKYRTRYPKKLFKDIIDIFGLSGDGSLLDLGCGTGELAIPLAKLFMDVLAVDPDKAMLAMGRQKAKEQKITNITWLNASFKELNHPNGSFRLITMGQSFHWMDQETALDRLYNLLERGGGLVIIGTESVEQGSVGDIKDEIVKKLIKKYLGPERRAGSKIYTPPPKKYDELIQNSKFVDFQELSYDVKVARNVDEILGNLFSMSWALKSHFGSQLSGFENELKSQLEALNPGGRFEEITRFKLYTMSK